MGVYSSGNSYGVPEDLIYSFPVVIKVWLRNSMNGSLYNISKGSFFRDIIFTLKDTVGVERLTALSRY